MSAAARKALFWLLMLAIPLQGIAGSLMPMRAIAHSAMRVQQGVADAAPSGMHMDGVTRHAAGDCASMLLADCDHPGSFKCGLMTACALVAAPGVLRPCVLQRQLSQAPVGAYLHLQVAFCTGAPERPPRLLA